MLQCYLYYFCIKRDKYKKLAFDNNFQISTKEIFLSTKRIDNDTYQTLKALHNCSRLKFTFLINLC